MSLLTGNFNYETVTFQGKTYITRNIHVPKIGTWTISDVALKEKLLVDGDGAWVCDEARDIDNSIDYYIAGWKLRSLSDEELGKAVAKECR